MGLWRTRGLEAGCYSVHAMLDGVDVGGVEVRLFDKGAQSAPAIQDSTSVENGKAHGKGTANPNAKGGKPQP
jgi:Cu/Zn superoxide dismutase